MKNYFLNGVYILTCNCLLLISIDSFSQSKMFNVTPDHSGIYQSDFSSEQNLEKKWSVKTNGKIFSSASVMNGVVYFGSDDNCLYAVDSKGKIKWIFKSNGKIRSTPAVNNTMVFFNNYGGKFYALDKETGKEIWSFTTDGESVYTAKGVNTFIPKDQMLEDPWDFFESSPVYIDNLVYFGSGRYMYALNLKSGKLLWKYLTPNVIHSTPAISDGILYFGCWNSKVYALDAQSGSKIWDYQAGTDTIYNYMAGIQSSPSVVDSMVFIGSRDANVYAIHAKTGRKLWSTYFNGSWMPSSFAILNDTIYTGSSDAAGFYALGKKDGNIQYSINFPSFAFSTPAYSKGTIFIGCANGSMYCIDAITRKIKARFDTDGHLKNYIHALNPDGSLNHSIFDPVSTADYKDALEYCNRLFSTGSIFSTPVIENEIIYFGSTDSSFYSIQNKGSGKAKP
jgi:eukaryotic-like serine/threonine-protein kinase